MPMTMGRGTQLTALALAALTLFTACTRAHEADRRLAKREALQPADLGSEWTTYKVRVHKRCMPRATACLDSILLTRPPRSGTGIALTTLFRTPDAALAAHRRTLDLLPPVGGSQVPPAAIAQLIGRRNERYSARLIARTTMRASRASAMLVVERIAITGGPDATHYDADLLYITDERTNMTVIVAPRRLLPKPQQLLRRLAARIETSGA